MAWSSTLFASGSCDHAIYMCDLHAASPFVSTMTGAWSSTLFASGSRDHAIYMRDLHAASPFVSKMTGHEQKGCGFKWSFDDQQVRRLLFCCLLFVSIK